MKRQNRLNLGRNVLYQYIYKYHNSYQSGTRLQSLYQNGVILDVWHLDSICKVAKMQLCGCNYSSYKSIIINVDLCQAK